MIIQTLSEVQEKLKNGENVFNNIGVPLEKVYYVRIVSSKKISVSSASIIMDDVNIVGEPLYTESGDVLIFESKNDGIIWARANLKEEFVSELKTTFDKIAESAQFYK